MYYTLRELSNHASELPLLPVLGADVLVRPGGSAGGSGGPKAGEDTWLRDHLPPGSYTPAWVTGMRGAEALHGKASCQAIAVNGSGPWVDHFVAGAAHLVRCAGVGGFYMDGIAFNRDAMKRMRRAAERAFSDKFASSDRRPLHFDNHPNNKTAVYIEMLPYFDSIWVRGVRRLLRARARLTMRHARGLPNRSVSFPTTRWAPSTTS